MVAGRVTEQRQPIRWRNEAGQAGRQVKRIVVAYEAGRDGFWLARWLRVCGIEAYVIHAASIAVSREHRRAKTDRLDTELLLRAFLGWLRGEKRHCSMVAIPTVEEEDARRPNRERGNLMLVNEVFSRHWRDRNAVARYAGLTGSPDESGRRRRERGLARAGNTRVRCGMIQFAWRFLRFQKNSALAQWFAARTADRRASTRKTMIVALARKLLIALWRLATSGDLAAELARVYPPLC